jgi:LytR cell envelope-related transcriptional attenuator
VIVWWRVLHRDDSSGASSSPQAPAPTCASSGHPVTFPKPARVSVTVYNAAGRDGLAATVGTQLKSRGFVLKSPQTAPSELTGVGQIQYGRSGRSGATLLALYVPGSKLVEISRSDAGVDLYLGTGFKSVASAASVRAAEAKTSKPCAGH